MRSGICRGLAVAIALGAAFTCLPAPEARADGLFHHDIPRETLALDYRTGDVMMAPPIPNGLYAKDPIGCVKNAAGVSFGAIHGLVGKVHGLCSRCGGPSCGNCGGGGLFHGRACGSCGGDGCGRCGSGGLLHGHGGDSGCGSGGCGSGIGGLFHHGDGALGHLGHGGHGRACSGNGCGHLASGQSLATPAAPAKTLGAPQAMSSGQIPAVCGGCLGTGRLGHGGGCGLCGGTGRLRNLLGHGNGCGSCGGRGCGACAGGQAGPCGACGGRGCGLCGGLGQNGLCRGCGGRGCGLCAGLKNKAHGLLGLPAGLVAKITHKGQIKYFVGAGGPVPITPGYVPYVVTTRSPRDFLAFPPFSDQIP